MRIAVTALCLVATIGSAFACAVTSGGFRFLIYQSDTGAWNINMGVSYFEEPKSFNVTVESKDSTGTFSVVYFLSVKGPKGIRNDDLSLHWVDTDGAAFMIGKGGSQTFSGTGTLSWNSAQTVFRAGHKNNITLTLTLLTTAAKGEYNAKMWVSFTETTVEARVTITPKVLNVKSKGQWVTACISLPEPYQEKDIDISSVKLSYKNSFVQAKSGEATKQFLLVKFSGDEVIKMLKSETGRVQLTVTGLVNGIEFSGTDTITLIKPGR